MSRGLRGERARDTAAAFAAGASLLCASLANFLHYNDYPLLRPEVGVAVAWGLLACAAIALLYQLKWWRPFLDGILAALFIDFNTDSMPLILAGGVGVAAVAAWRKKSLMGPMAVLGLVVLLTTLAGVGGSASWITTVERKPVNSNASDKPAIVHIILDEHLGIEGLASEGPEGGRLADDLRATYLGAGFAVYGGAYSQHYHSANSIPYILNLGKDLARGRDRRGVRIGPTVYLQKLVDQGYRLTIFQSDYADFCSGAAFDTCVTYNSGSMRPVLAAPMSTADRASLNWNKFTQLSDVAVVFLYKWNKAAASLQRYGVDLPSYQPGRAKSSSVGTMEALNPLSSMLKQIRPGEAVFAHLLLPHHPYVVNRNCRYLPWPWESLRSGASAQIKQAAYHEQVRCTSRMLLKLLEAISRSPAGPNTVVILHGDHGSRISAMGAGDQTSAKYSDSDMVEAFSTLFAVRGPGLHPSYSDAKIPVAALLQEFAASNFTAAPAPQPPREHCVYLTNSAWKPVRRVRMPVNWMKAGGGFPTDDPVLYASGAKGCHA